MMKYSLFTLTLFLCLLAVSCKDSDPAGPGTDDKPDGGTDAPTYAVSVAVEPAEAGAVDGAGTFEAGEAIQLSATPAEGYRFGGWSGDAEGTDNPLDLTVDQAYSLTASFELKDYALSVATDGEGTVAETVLQAKDYAHGTLVELTATPAEGYRFTGWQGALSGDENPAQITVDSPKAVTAVFEKKTYPLTVTTDGQGAVSEEVVTAKSYAHGTLVELTASPAASWGFVEWQGDAGGSDNPAQITVDEAKTVTAVFAKAFYRATNGVTIRCPGVAVGDSFTLDGMEYTRRTAAEIKADPSLAPTACTSGITDMNELFYNATTFNEDISHWDVSSVTDMEAMFYQANYFNQDISAWDVSNVTDMRDMFAYAHSFNQPIGDWNVSSVTDMESIFSHAIYFNQDISAWDVSKVTDMSSMFINTEAFNADLSGWDVSSVTDMSAMFTYSVFDQDLSGWCVSEIGSKPANFDSGAGFEGDATRQPQWGEPCTE